MSWIATVTDNWTGGLGAEIIEKRTKEGKYVPFDKLGDVIVSLTKQGYKDIRLISNGFNAFEVIATGDREEILGVLLKERPEFRELIK